MVHYTSLILLAKPFVPAKISARPDDGTAKTLLEPKHDLARRALEICQDSATEICNLGNRYRESFGSFRRSPLTATHCTLMACLVKLFLASPDDGPSTRRTSEDLKSCISTFQELSESWTPPRRCLQMLSRVPDNDFRKLMNRAEAASQKEGANGDAARLNGKHQQVPQNDPGNSPLQHRGEDILPYIDHIDTSAPEDSLSFSHPWLSDQLESMAGLDELDYSALNSLPWDYI